MGQQDVALNGAPHSVAVGDSRSTISGRVSGFSFEPSRRENKASGRLFNSPRLNGLWASGAKNASSLTKTDGKRPKSQVKTARQAAPYVSSIYAGTGALSAVRDKAANADKPSPTETSTKDISLLAGGDLGFGTTKSSKSAHSEADSISRPAPVAHSPKISRKDDGAKSVEPHADGGSLSEPLPPAQQQGLDQQIEQNIHLGQKCPSTEAGVPGRAISPMDAQRAAQQVVQTVAEKRKKFEEWITQRRQQIAPGTDVASAVDLKYEHSDFFCERQLRNLTRAELLHRWQAALEENPVLSHEIKVRPETQRAIADEVAKRCIAEGMPQYTAELILKHEVFRETLETSLSAETIQRWCHEAVGQMRWYDGKTIDGKQEKPSVPDLPTVRGAQRLMEIGEPTVAGKAKLQAQEKGTRDIIPNVAGSISFRPTVELFHTDASAEIREAANFLDRMSDMQKRYPKNLTKKVNAPKTLPALDSEEPSALGALCDLWQKAISDSLPRNATAFVENELPNVEFGVSETKTVGLKLNASVSVLSFLGPLLGQLFSQFLTLGLYAEPNVKLLRGRGVQFSVKSSGNNFSLTATTMGKKNQIGVGLEFGAGVKTRTIVGAGGTMYVSMDVSLAGKEGRDAATWTVTFDRIEGKTPEEIRIEALDAISEYLRQLENEGTKESTAPLDGAVVRITEGAEGEIGKITYTPYTATGAHSEGGLTASTTVSAAAVASTIVGSSGTPLFGKLTTGGAISAEAGYDTETWRKGHRPRKGSKQIDEKPVDEKRNVVKKLTLNVTGATKSQASLLPSNGSPVSPSSIPSPLGALSETAGTTYDVSEFSFADLFSKRGVATAQVAQADISMVKESILTVTQQQLLAQSAAPTAPTPEPGPVTARRWYESKELSITFDKHAELTKWLNKNGMTISDEDAENIKAPLIVTPKASFTAHCTHDGSGWNVKVVADRNEELSISRDRKGFGSVNYFFVWSDKVEANRSPRPERIVFKAQPEANFTPPLGRLASMVRWVDRFFRIEKPVPDAKKSGAV
ncbi:hypothetical protein [Paraburkholderia sediminicola]|uniref:hypothetical protein n=1 Tax=Paraburkholderia sediminicola TaxID=458836 RepID=UPI0038BB882D